jgi:hypothetical protein
MTTVTTKPELLHSTTESDSDLFDDWFDPIETGVRDRVRELIEEMVRGELNAVLPRPRYGRRAGRVEGSDAPAVQRLEKPAAGLLRGRHGRRRHVGLASSQKSEPTRTGEES